MLNNGVQDSEKVFPILELTDGNVDELLKINKLVSIYDNTIYHNTMYQMFELTEGKT